MPPVAPVDLDIRLNAGWNVVGLGCSETPFATASAMAADIEANTNLDVLTVHDWEGGWDDYIRRDGDVASDYKLLPVFSYTDFSLDTANECYMIFCRANTTEDGGSGADKLWEVTGASTAETGVLQDVPLVKGWNNVRYPYTGDANTLTLGEIVAQQTYITAVAAWDAGTGQGQWVTDGTSPSWGFNDTGTYEYTKTENAAGLFVRSDSTQLWDQA